MDKRRIRADWKKAFLGAAIIIGTLLLTIAVLALLIGKGVLEMEAQHICLNLCCLVSASLGALYSANREGRAVKLLAGSIPALLLLLISVSVSIKESSFMNVVIYSACLMIPSAAAAIYRGGRRRRRGKNRKHRSFSKPRR